MGNERLTLEILTQASGQESIDRLSSAMNRFSAASEDAANKATKSFSGVTQAAEGTHGSVRRLFLAVKDLGEGRSAFATVEAGYFIQSLGGVATAAGFAAVAVGALAYGVYKAAEIAREGGSKMALAFDGLNHSLKASNDELRVTGDRLRDEIAKLEGKPQNNLVLSLDEARVAADKLADSIAKDVAALGELFKKDGIGAINGLLTRRSNTGSDEKEVKEFSTRLSGIDRAGLASVRGAKTDDERKAAQDAWNKAALKELDEESAKFSRLIEQSQTLDKLSKGGLSASEVKQYVAKFGPIETSQNESARLAERQGTLGNINEIRDSYALTTGNNDASAEKNKLQAAKDLKEEQKRAAGEATTALAHADDMQLAHLKSIQDMSVGAVAQYWEKRLSVESGNVDRVREITEKIGTLRQEEVHVMDRVARRGEEIQKQEKTKDDERAKAYAALIDENDKLNEAAVKREGERQVKLADLRTKGAESSTLGGLDRQRASAGRSGALTPIGSSQLDIVAARVNESQQMLSIDREEAKVRIAAAAEEAMRAKVQYGEDSVEYQTYKDKITDISRQANAKIYDDETRTLELIHNEREKELNTFKSSIGSAFDALMNNSFSGFLKSQALGIGRTITENAAALALPAIEKMIPHASGGLGNLLKGTPFGPDPLKTATDLNTAATVANTQALALSKTGGGGGLPGGVFNGSTGNPFVFSATGGGGIGGDIGDGLPMSSGAYGATAAGNAMGSVGGKGFGLNLGTAAKAAAVGGGALSAFSDFKTGGVKNDIAGVGGLLASGAGIAAMFGPAGAPAAIGLGIAALATTFIASIFPDPKKVRETAINKEIERGAYHAPTALNVSQDTSGNFSDFDARGNVRSSSFRAVPQVTDPYTWWKGNTPYQVPGNVTSPYSTSQPAAPTTIIIQAADAQSFNDMANRNKAGLSDAIATHLQNGDSRLHGAIRSVAGV